MAKYLVTYDLVDGKDYGRIIKELERLSAVRTQFSTYLVGVTTETAAGFLQHLKGFVDADDRLMVVKLYEKPAWTVGLSGTTDWVTRNFPG